MKMRFDGCSSVAGVCLGVGILLAVLPETATATPVPMATVILINCGITVNQSLPWVSTALNAGGPSCGGTGSSAAGSADFAYGSVSVDLISIPGRGLTGKALLEDFLTFHVAGGGSAQVGVHLVGTWSGTPNVGTEFAFTLDLGNLSQIRERNDGGSPFFSDNTLNAGTYHYDTLWTVFDSQTLSFAVAVEASAAGAAIAHIEDPLTLTLPTGVTFTADSGLTYSTAGPSPGGPSTVPEPSTWLLIGSGLAAVAARRLLRT